jgi:RNA polymerase sigma-70 factor, ECF subfamily
MDDRDRDDHDDAALVEGAAGGDSAAFGALVRRHLPAALSAARWIVGERADAEDVCQDAFLAALVHIEACRPAHLFRGWLLQIVRRRALDLCRRERVRAAATLGSTAGEVDVPAPVGEGPGARAERADARARLRSALAGLSVRQRRAIVLHDVLGCSHREIASRLGIAEGTARAQLFAARRRMRERLTPDLRPSA